MRSVLAQSAPDWRLTVVEDGDQRQGAGPWLRSLRDERVRHALNPRNLGVSANFQHCLDLATNPYVCFLGCDDRLLPDYTRHVLEQYRTHESAVAIVPRVQLIDAAGDPSRSTADLIKDRIRPRRSGPMSGEALLASLMRGNWTYFPSICWRTEALRGVGFRQDLPVLLDLAALTSLLLAGEEVVLSDAQVFEYRRHSGSASSLAASDTSRFDEEARFMHEMATACHDRGWSRAASAARHRWTSRLHAGLLLPRARSRTATGALARHAFLGWR